ncbi:MAG: rhodanese-like domain-containing protein [Wenzhouxiangella sp.]
MLRSLLLVVAVMWLAVPALAEEYGMSAAEAFAAVNDPEQAVLFVDVRDPVEIMFVGWTDSADVNIPFLLVDRTGWNADSGSFPMPRNPDFTAQVEAALAARGLDRDALIITMCRSGSARGEPSARALREAGFSNARFVRHGFQGDRIGDGEHAGLRLKNGWQNEGLPWQPRMNPDKIFRPGD